MNEYGAARVRRIDERTQSGAWRRSLPARSSNTSTPANGWPSAARTFPVIEPVRVTAGAGALPPYVALRLARAVEIRAAERQHQ